MIILPTNSMNLTIFSPGNLLYTFTACPFSDLDLCYQDPIPSYEAVQIKGELEDSNLPFIVELVNWQRMRQAFREAIQKDLVMVSPLAG